MKASLKVDTVIKKARVMGMQIKELFVSEEDYIEINEEGKKNFKSFPKEKQNELKNLMYKTEEAGLVKISKKGKK